MIQACSKHLGGAELLYIGIDICIYFFKIRLLVTICFVFGFVDDVCIKIREYLVSNGPLLAL